MSKENEHISEYDMQRYLNGDMDAKEQHALEAKLENDELAYEAVEGLEKVSEADMARMLQKMQLSAAKEEQSFSWMKIAAAITIAMMAGLGIWYFSQTAPPSQIAYEEPPEVKKNEQAPSSAERAAPTSETTPKAITEMTDDNVTIETEQGIVEISVPAEVEDIDPPSPKLTEALSAVRNEVAISLEGDNAVEDEIEMAEAVMDEALAEIVVEDIVPETQVAQSFEMASGAAADQPVSRSAPVTRSMALQSFNSNAPQPIDGFELYQRYLVDSLRYEVGMEVGMVTLRFKIDEVGAPVSIQIIQSLNEAADAEAIRLVGEGPKWSGNAGVPTTLSVPIKPK